MPHQLLSAFRHDLQRELGHTLEWWETHMVDDAQGGFYGRLDNQQRPDPAAPRGLVLYSRIMWTFAAASRALQRPAWLDTADRAWTWLREAFADTEYGGVFWSVAPDGAPLNTRKQVYGQAFALYGLSEYARAGGPQDALEMAISLFHWIEQHSFDSVRGGYLEAFARDGSALTDLRLAPRDLNVPKTMLTQLHLLEAYANLYRIWPDARLAQQLRHLIQIFLDYIVNPLSGHLCLFFDTGWAPQSDLIAYGRDIEAAWLLLDAAEVLGDMALIQKCRDNAVIMAIAAARGLDTDGGLWQDNHVREKHWWAQAEAIVGFLNAWQISGERHFFDKSLGAWRFVQRYLLDRPNGEWFWGVDAHQQVLSTADKAGFWKCPYHQGRACLELIERIPA